VWLMPETRHIRIWDVEKREPAPSLSS
jgi:hypothetical protein